MSSQLDVAATADPGGGIIGSFGQDWMLDNAGAWIIVERLK